MRYLMRMVVATTTLVVLGSAIGTAAPGFSHARAANNLARAGRAVLHAVGIDLPR